LIARGDENRHVVVHLCGGRLQSDEVAEASERAIQTSGKSAVSDVLGEDEPPWRLVLTSDGIRRDDY
jgi:hypothetical protein